MLRLVLHWFLFTKYNILIFIPHWLQQLCCKSRARSHQMTLCSLLLDLQYLQNSTKVFPEITICETQAPWVNTAPRYIRSALTADLLPLVSLKAAALHRVRPHKNITKITSKCTGFAWTIPSQIAVPGPRHQRNSCHLKAELSKHCLKSTMQAKGRIFFYSFSKDKKLKRMQPSSTEIS